MSNSEAVTKNTIEIQTISDNDAKFMPEGQRETRASSVFM